MLRLKANPMRTASSKTRERLTSREEEDTAANGISDGGGAACASVTAHSNRLGISRAATKKQAGKIDTLGVTAYDKTIIVPQMAPS